MSLIFFRCVARAFVKNGFKHLISCHPLGAFLYDVAQDTAIELKAYSRDQRRLALEAVASATAPEANRQAEVIAAEVTSVVEERVALAGYLARLPGVVRRSLARPEDMSGRTLPAGIPLDRLEDIVPFLPKQASRLRAGGRVEGCGMSWELKELLGVGGFSEVWKACPSAAADGVLYALKFCLDPTALASLRNEEKLLRRLRAGGFHSGLVPLLFNCLAADPPFLVFDYIPGGDLTRLIRCWHPSPLPSPRLVPESVRLLKSLAGFLCDAHELPEPIVHRDLKPSNILLQPTRAGKVKLRIADFGIGGISARFALDHTATISAKEALTTSMQGAHTPLYASPQQMNGEPADPRDDVFALGVILYQVLTGDTTVAPPPDMEDVLADREVPQPLIAGLDSCLATENQNRLPNARAVVQMLSSV